MGQDWKGHRDARIERFQISLLLTKYQLERLKHRGITNDGNVASLHANIENASLDFDDSALAPFLSNRQVPQGPPSP